MSEKRKDNRGRVLHNGEIQRKDGRYQFKYIDANGKEKFVYSWRLDHNDATPQGKVRTLSLREMERQIQADLFDVDVLPHRRFVTDTPYKFFSFPIAESSKDVIL